jgi:hypothetical protein
VLHTLQRSCGAQFAAGFAIVIERTIVARMRLRAATDVAFMNAKDVQGVADRMTLWRFPPKEAGVC